MQHKDKDNGEARKAFECAVLPCAREWLENTSSGTLLMGVWFVNYNLTCREVIVCKIFAWNIKKYDRI
jgi:hypothetical protein